MPEESAIEITKGKLEHDDELQHRIPIIVENITKLLEFYLKKHIFSFPDSVFEQI